MSGWRDRAGCNGMPGHTRLVELVLLLEVVVELLPAAEAIFLVLSADSCQPHLPRRGWRAGSHREFQLGQLSFPDSQGR